MDQHRSVQPGHLGEAPRGSRGAGAGGRSPVRHERGPDGPRRGTGRGAVADDRAAWDRRVARAVRARRAAGGTRRVDRGDARAPADAGEGDGRRGGALGRRGRPVGRAAGEDVGGGGVRRLPAGGAAVGGAYA